PFQSQRGPWLETTAAHPRMGWFPAESFDVESFRTNRKGPAYKRMTDRDAYWGAKLVTSFTDAQIAAVVAATDLERDDAAYVARGLGVRRDIIGHRYLTAVTAVQAPAVVGARAPAQIRFQELAVPRGRAQAPPAPPHH